MKPLAFLWTLTWSSLLFFTGLMISALLFVAGASFISWSIPNFTAENLIILRILGSLATIVGLWFTVDETGGRSYWEDK